MLFSYHWLQTYFNEPLPAPQNVADILTFHALEVESVTREGDDWIFEVDILPNRRHDCLSHLGIAREISVLAGIPLARDPFHNETPAWNMPPSFHTVVSDSRGCPRYMAALMRGVLVGESPDWLKDRLRAVGQKPINTIVDATNYIMFELGQPLHAFDAERFAKEGDMIKIGVRNARKGEPITLLGGAEYVLQGNDLVIVDGVSDSPLGIAGIKGGRAGEISEKTRNIIIESANFNPVRIRKTATCLGLRTDASMRFESGLAPKQTEYALKEVIMLIEKLTGATLLGVADVVKWEKKPLTIPLSVGEINNLLGTDMDTGVFKNVLEELHFSYTGDEEKVRVTPPFERLDVETKEDLIEEVGRVYGYEKIMANPLPSAGRPAVNKTFYYTEKIRDILTSQGFSEVYTHAIGTKGEVGLENPLAEDKRFLRATLHGLQFLDALHMNMANRERLELESAKIFEVGKVFRTHGEYWELAIGGNSAKEVAETLFGLLGVSIQKPEFLEGNLVSYNLEKIISQLPEPPERYEPYNKPEIEPRYRSISPYPFMLRDIAVFVPEGTESTVVRDIVKKEAGRLLVGARLFDEFKKDGKISYALRLVFQSHEKTLNDREVNEIMERVTHTLNAQEGFIVR